MLESIRRIWNDLKRRKEMYQYAEYQESELRRALALWCKGNTDDATFETEFLKASDRYKFFCLTQFCRVILQTTRITVLFDRLARIIGSHQNYTTYEGDTLVHIVVAWMIIQGCNGWQLEILHRYGYDFSIVNLNGDTPLALLFDHNMVVPIFMLDDEKAIKTTIQSRPELVESFFLCFVGQTDRIIRCLKMIPEKAKTREYREEVMDVVIRCLPGEDIEAVFDQVYESIGTVLSHTTVIRILSKSKNLNMLKKIVKLGYDPWEEGYDYSLIDQVCGSLDLSYEIKLEVIQFLLENSTHVCSADEIDFGRSIIRLLLWHMNLPETEVQETQNTENELLELISLFIRHPHFDPDRIHHYNRTVLYYAFDSGKIPVIEALMAICRYDLGDNHSLPIITAIRRAEPESKMEEFACQMVRSRKYGREKITDNEFNIFEEACKKKLYRLISELYRYGDYKKDDLIHLEKLDSYLFAQMTGLNSGLSDETESTELIVL